MRNQMSSANESKNEFMHNQTSSISDISMDKQKVDEFQRIFSVFQKMATNPEMFMKMMSSVKQPSLESEPRRRQFQVEQHKYRNHEVSPRRNAQSPVNGKDSRKRGTDVLQRSYVQQNDNVLERYYQGPNDNSNIAQSKVTLSGKQQHLNKFEDNRPIQSAYARQAKPEITKKYQYNQQLPLPKPKVEDDRPIKPVKGYSYQPDLNQSAIITNPSIQPLNPSKYWEAEERPIKGIQGDFKAHIMKEQGLPISQYPDNEQVNNNQEQNREAPKARQFLKRGSRQHLSSAADRSVKKQKPGKKNNQKQDLDASMSNTNNFGDEFQKNDRSISQNRVLGRKSISSKSISKKPPPKPKVEQQKRTMQYSNTTTNYNEATKSPRAAAKKQTKSQYRESPTSPTFQKESQPKQKKQVKKQVKKNIFQDSSSDEDNGHQAQRKPIENKNEVIPGIFLTKKQIHSILSKYGKSAPPTTASTSQSQVQQLKSKYIDLCNILAEQRQAFELTMQKQREQFEAYKLSQLNKIKNQRKVQERNLLNTQKTKQKEKQREDFQNLRKVLQKQREQFKHKQKNYRIMIDKYKKLAEEKEKLSSSSVEQKYASYEPPKNQETGKKPKASIRVQQNSVHNQQQLPGPGKGRQQNYNISNNRIVKQQIPVKEIKDTLPNYQDLKKPNSHQGKLVHPSSTTQQNKKYEYYEDVSNRETLKTNDKFASKYHEEDQVQEDNRFQEDEDREEIVEYNPSMKLSDLCKIPLSIKMVTDEMIHNLFRCQNHPDYRKYLELVSRPRTKINSNRNPVEKRVTNVYADGGKEVIFDTGVRKQNFSNGYTIIFFTNGDIKQKLPDETVLYFYREKEVDQITLPNKINIYRFDNNQVEFHFEDKSVQIRHPDGTFKTI